MSILALILLVSAVVLIVLMLGAWIRVLQSFVRAVRNVKEGIPYKALYFNPYNVVWRVEYLTEKGLKYREQYIIALKSLVLWTGLSAANVILLKMTGYF